MHARTRWGVAILLLTAIGLGGGCARGVIDPEAAPSDPPTVGLLRVVPDEDHGAFVDELRSRGWALGRDFELLPGDAETVYADVDEADEVLRAWLSNGVDLVIAFSTPFARLVAESAPDTPVLFMVNDPVASGLVDDLSSPEGNLTGVTFRAPADRTLDLALQMVPGDRRVGYLWPADDPAVPGHRSAVRAAADALDIELVEASFRGPDDVPAAVETLVAADVTAVILASSSATFRSLPELEKALDHHRLPTVANTDVADFAVLIVTPDGAELRRQLARQAARLLDGADVSAVPVENPRKFLIVMNRTKVEELGLPPPPPEVLRLADVVR